LAALQFVDLVVFFNEDTDQQTAKQPTHVPLSSDPEAAAQGL
jgi:hypothetical protein